MRTNWSFDRRVRKVIGNRHSCAALVGISCVYLAACGSSTSSGAPAPAQNPIPAIVTLSPNNYNQNDTAFTLSIVGSNFMSGSVIQWGGNARQTSFVSSALLTTQITSSDLASAGATSVTVMNPSRGRRFQCKKLCRSLQHPIPRARRLADQGSIGRILLRRLDQFAHQFSLQRPSRRTV